MADRESMGSLAEDPASFDERFNAVPPTPFDDRFGAWPKPFDEYLAEAAAPRDRPWGLLQQAKAGAAEGLARHLGHYISPQDVMTGTYDPEERAAQIGALARIAGTTPPAVDTDPAGRYTRSVMGVVANPSSYWGVNPAAGVPWAIGAGVGAEAVGHPFQGTRAEPWARMAGSWSPMVMERAYNALPTSSVGAIGGKMIIPQPRTSPARSPRAVEDYAPAEGSPASPPPRVEDPSVVALGQPGQPVMGSVAAPAVLPRQLPTAEDIGAIKAAAREAGHGPWPTAEQPLFATTPEAYAETAALVPQTSIKERLPGPLPGEKLPGTGRVAPLIEHAGAIGSLMAERLDPLVRAQSPLLQFYSTGPVIRGLEKYGEAPQGPAQFMRDWAGQGAATSPKTKTPPNLRNASFLMYERARGDPLTRARFDVQGNEPGYGMMGSHVDLADVFARGAENPWTNPKPTTFRENWSGNLADVTGDTHVIRGALHYLDQVRPGALPPDWFKTPAAYQAYRDGGMGAVPPGGIKDTLEGRTVAKAFRQSEYLPVTEPTYLAAQQLGITPAQTQSGGWFSMGGLTNLRSPPKTIPHLLNDQIEATARAAHVPPEKIVNWWSRGLIPLAGVGGAAAAPALMGELARQDQQ